MRWNTSVNLFQFYFVEIKGTWFPLEKIEHIKIIQSWILIYTHCTKKLSIWNRSQHSSYLTGVLFSHVNATHLKIGHLWIMGYSIFKWVTKTWLHLTARWHHQMETFSALLALCAGNSLVTGEFPSQRPVTRSFDVFFDLCLNKRFSKQSWGRWFETPSRSLSRHCNGTNYIGRPAKATMRNSSITSVF